MPREVDMQKLNYSGKEFLMEMARLKKPKGEPEGELINYDTEEQISRRFNTCMNKLKRCFGYGQNDFQSRGIGKGGAYVFMPEYAEYLTKSAFAEA